MSLKSMNVSFLRRKKLRIRKEDEAEEASRAFGWDDGLVDRYQTGRFMSASVKDDIIVSNN